MRRSNKAVKGKRKVAAKKARPAIKRRAVPERIRSDRHVEEVRSNAEQARDRGNGQQCSPSDRSGYFTC